MELSLIQNLGIVAGFVLILTLIVIKFMAKNDKKDEEKEGYEKLSQEERAKLEEEKDEKISFFMIFDDFPSSITKKTVDKKLEQLKANSKKSQEEEAKFLKAKNLANFFKYEIRGLI
jgi:hypothetical protein